jgi:16S rRNA (cytidine1402-2'-O)-methyltransferase
MSPMCDNGSRSAAPRGPALYVVATPIGNLEDITLRALSVLRSVDFIVCEDTRRTLGLLRRHGIEKELVASPRFNEEKGAGAILERLRSGGSAACVSEGGTPAVSDPGARLVERARAAGIPVIPVPGPCAVTAALSVAGWEGGFVFAGFVERKKEARRTQIRTLSSLPWACVLFESPERVRRALADIADILGDRPLLMAREMTKMFEQVLKAPAGQILRALPEDVKGEIALVLFPPGKGGGKARSAGADLGKVLRACREMIASGVKPSRAAALASSLAAIPKETIMKALAR